MSKLIELVEEMRIRLNEIATSEQALVRALGDALSRVDQKLLQDVRAITAEHEVRRGTILSELQNLAARIGTFPRESAPSLEYAAPEPARSYVPPPAAPQPALNGSAGSAGLDWRQATAAAIHEELSHHFKNRLTN